MINIAGLDKAQLLVALHEVAVEPLGIHLSPFNLELARKNVRDRIARNRPLQFNVLHGRNLLVDITGDELDGKAFDAANGDDLSATVVQKLRGEVKT